MGQAGVDFQRSAGIFRILSNEKSAHPALDHGMRRLSHELLAADLVHWIRPKLNMQWDYYKTLHDPLLRRPTDFKLFRWPRVSVFETLLYVCVNAAPQHNYSPDLADGSKDSRLTNAD